MVTALDIDEAVKFLRWGGGRQHPEGHGEDTGQRKPDARMDKLRCADIIDAW